MHRVRPTDSDSGGRAGCTVEAAADPAAARRRERRRWPGPVKVITAGESVLDEGGRMARERGGVAVPQDERVEREGDRLFAQARVRVLEQSGLDARIDRLGEFSVPDEAAGEIDSRPES